MKIHTVKGEHIGIGRIDPTTSDNLLTIRARQVSRFMLHVVQPHYEDTLGLRRTDTDPRPDPFDDDHIRWRLGRMRSTGPVEHAGREFIGAFLLDSDGKPTGDVAGLVGLLLLAKPNGLCEADTHTVTEIDEFDTAPAYRGQGVGRELLRYGMQGVHPEDELLLDVAEPNKDARAVYANYGFVYTGAPPVRHEVFDVEHIGMRADAAAFQSRLGITAK